MKLNLMFSMFLAIFVSGMLLGIIVIRKPALFVSQLNSVWPPSHHQKPLETI